MGTLIGLKLIIVPIVLFLSTGQQCYYQLWLRRTLVRSVRYAALHNNPMPVAKFYYFIC